MKREPFQKANLAFSIQIVNRVGEPRIYQVAITGDDVRNFFVGITPTQNARHGVKALIQTWCEQHGDKWPKDGETVAMDLDEVQVARQRLGYGSQPIDHNTSSGRQRPVSRLTGHMEASTHLDGFRFSVCYREL